MIRWTGLAPWESEFPFPGSLTSTILGIHTLSMLEAAPISKRNLLATRLCAMNSLSLSLSLALSHSLTLSLPLSFSHSNSCRTTSRRSRWRSTHGRRHSARPTSWYFPPTSQPKPFEERRSSQRELEPFARFLKEKLKFPMGLRIRMSNESDLS